MWMVVIFIPYNCCPEHSEWNCELGLGQILPQLQGKAQLSQQIKKKLTLFNKYEREHYAY